MDDCGECVFCLDKPKFGGPNTKRQKCVHKQNEASHASGAGGEDAVAAAERESFGLPYNIDRLPVHAFLQMTARQNVRAELKRIGTFGNPPILVSEESDRPRANKKSSYGIYL